MGYNAADLVVYDTAVASDHLPVVADFIFPVPTTGDRTAEMEYKEQKKPKDLNK